MEGTTLQEFNVMPGNSNTTTSSSPQREDDQDGHFVFSIGDNLTSRYIIEQKIGQGTFGQVFQCWDRVKKQSVAIKVSRSSEDYRDYAMNEIDVLEQLCTSKAKSRFVQIKDWFDYRNHICIVFEKLGPSLLSFHQKNEFDALPINLLRNFCKQLLEGIELLHELRLVHTDLKPDNILLVGSEYVNVTSIISKERFWCKHVPKSSAIKVIDLGSAVEDNKENNYVVTTSHYRAPEVILGLGWGRPCDLWSIGCILFELCTGEILFPTGEDALEHLAMMQNVLGPLPRRMLRKSNQDVKKHVSKGRLKWPQDCTSQLSYDEVSILMCLEYRILEYMEERDGGDLIDLLFGLLKYDPSDRLSARKALRHPFFTGSSRVNT